MTVAPESARRRLSRGGWRTGEDPKRDRTVESHPSKDEGWGTQLASPQPMWGRVFDPSSRASSTGQTCTKLADKSMPHNLSAYGRNLLNGRSRGKQQKPFRTGLHFVVFTESKRVEKLRYMHRNPVVRGLVLEPEHWNWSSYRHYALGERGPVLVNEVQKAEMRVLRDCIARVGQPQNRYGPVVPTRRKPRRVGQPFSGIVNKKLKCECVGQPP